MRLVIAIVAICLIGSGVSAQQPPTTTTYIDAAGNVWQLVKAAPVPNVTAPIPFATVSNPMASSCSSSMTATTSATSSSCGSSATAQRRGLFGRVRNR